MKFTRLKLDNWRQFTQVDIEFHPRLTVITGANGTGKSTILRLLASHFGWQSQMLSTPRETKGGQLTYFTGAYKALIKTLSVLRPQGAVQEPMSVIGSVEYSNKVISELAVPPHSGAIYNVTLTAQQVAPGVYIPSHRHVSNYQQVGNIPIVSINAGQAYGMYLQAQLLRYNNAAVNGQLLTPLYRMKEYLISMALFGPGNKNVKSSAEVVDLFESFKIILSKILPPTLGFRDISIRIPDVVITTDTGDFIIDAASGGLMSLIDLAWQIFLFSRDKSEFIVALDEPENHLHPSMQRSVLSRLLSAFPNGQFVVATHSPFVVSSVKESSVYALTYADALGDSEADRRRHVDSIKLEIGSRAGSANDILREALGVPVTLPEWAEDELSRIAKDFSVRDLDDHGIQELRRRLGEAGLADYYPEALCEVVSPR